MIWHSHTADEILMELNTDRHTGLSDATARQRLEEYGENRPKELPVRIRAVRCFRAALLFLIIGCMLITALSYYNYLVNDHPFQWVDALVTLVCGLLLIPLYVFSLSAVRRAQENARLATTEQTEVLREGITVTLPVSALVPGDILHLRAGMAAPADCRLVEAHDLVCDEHALTADNRPVSKNADALFEDITPMPMRGNMVYAGSHIVDGTATAVVVATGQQSELGRIAPPSRRSFPLLEQIDKRTRWLYLGLAVVTVLLATFIFWMHTDKTQGLIIAVALPLAASPVFWPLLTGRLTFEGICRAAQDDIIIKQPDAVEALATADTVCTDRTEETPGSDIYPLTAFVNNDTFPLDDQYIQQSQLPVRLAAMCLYGKEYDAHSLEQNLLLHCGRTGTHAQQILADMPRLESHAYDDYTVSIHQANARALIIVCGDPNVITPHCAKGNEGAEQAAAIIRRQHPHALAVAFRFADEVPESSSLDEGKLTLAGILGGGHNRPDKQEELCLAGMPTIAVDGAEDIYNLTAKGYSPLYVAQRTDRLATSAAATVTCAHISAWSQIKEIAALLFTAPTKQALPDAMAHAQGIQASLCRTAYYLLSGVAAILCYAFLLVFHNATTPAPLLWCALWLQGALTITPLLYKEIAAIKTRKWMGYAIPCIGLPVCLLLSAWCGVLWCGTAETMAYITLTVGTVLTAPCALCPLPLGKRSIKDLRIPFICSGICAVVTVAAAYIPGLQALFGLTTPGIGAIIIALLLALLPAVSAEVCKRLTIAKD